MTSEDQRQLIGRMAAHQSWANTADRTARTRNARRAGPASIEWHLERLPATLDNARPKDRMAAAESARKAYYARLAMKSAAARRR